MPEYGVTTTT